MTQLLARETLHKEQKEREGSVPSDFNGTLNCKNKSLGVIDL